VPLLSDVGVLKQANPPHICSYFKDYVFQDATGGRHSLKIADVTTPSTCTSVVPTPAQVLNGGDDYYRASLSSGGGSGTLSIADAAGTVYGFPPADQDHVNTNPDYTNESSLPYSMEDRNGNQVAVNDLDRGGNGVLGSFTVTDPLGRTLLSSSGFGVSGNTLAVSGLSTPYSVTWGRRV